jgi:predicted aconitase with swiveling domain
MLTQVGVPLLAAALTAVLSAIATRLLTSEYHLLPPPVSRAPSRHLGVFRRKQYRYEQLQGKWHGYHVSGDRRIATGPIWQHHLHFFLIRGSLLAGVSYNMNHPGEQLIYDLRGELRGDVLVITLTCRQLVGDVGTIQCNNILAGAHLTGTLMGTNYDRGVIVSIEVLSRVALDEPALQAILVRESPDFLASQIYPALPADCHPEPRAEGESSSANTRAA